MAAILDYDVTESFETDRNVSIRFPGVDFIYAFSTLCWSNTNRWRVMGILVILAAILKDDVISTCVYHFRDVHPGFSYTLDHPLLISGESCRGPHNSTGFLPAAPLDNSLLLYRHIVNWGHKQNRFFELINKVIDQNSSSWQ